MKIEWKKKERKTRPFSELKDGDVFTAYGCEDAYMKLENNPNLAWCSSVNLSNGTPATWIAEAPVYPLAATLLVEEAT